MNEVLERRFAEMGARVSLGERPWRGRPRIDVRADAQGEFFTIDFSGRGTESRSRSSTFSRATGTCSCSSVTAGRRASSSAAMTSATGSSPPSPRPPAA